MKNAFASSYRDLANNLPLLPVGRQFSTYPSRGLTLGKIQQYLEQAEHGDVSKQAELMQDIFEKDPTIASAFETRALAVQSVYWDILPSDPANIRSVEQAKWVRKVLDKTGSAYASRADSSRFLSFEEFLWYISTAVPMGFAACNMLWNTTESKIDAFVPIEQKYFRWGEQSKMGSAEYNPYELRILTEANSVDGEPISPYNYVVHTFKHTPYVPGRRGLIRQLVYWYLFKNFGVRSMVRYAERTGEPIRIGRYNPNVEGEFEIVKRAVRELGTDASAVISKDASLEFVGHDRSAANDIHTRLIGACNQEISKLILGHSAAQEATPGKLGGDDQKMEVQQYRIEADSRAEENTVNAQVIAPMTRFVDGVCLCYYKRRYEQEEDMNSRADRYVKLKDLVEIPKTHIREAFDLPEPKEDEETTAPSVLPFSRRFKNVRIDRKRAAIKLHDQLEEDANRYALQTQPLYDMLLDSVSTDMSEEQIGRAIERNKQKFTSALYGTLRTAFNDVGTETVKAITPAQKGERYKGVDIDWSLNDDKAAHFLDWQSFTVSQVDGEYITRRMKETLRRELNSAQREGLTLRQFKDNVLENCGVGRINNGHLTTIYRTNIATASAASTLFTMAKTDGFPAWQFMAILDDVTRDDHAALDGMIFANGDNTYFPPIDFNCRCTASPITQEEFEAEGYEVEARDPEIELPESFQNTAVENFTKWAEAKANEYPDIAQSIVQHKEKS